MAADDKVRALCCHCGSWRLVHRGFTRYDANYTDDIARDSHGWRMTMTLHCSACEAPTRHAMLRDGDPHRDIAEIENRARTRH